MLSQRLGLGPSRVSSQVPYSTAFDLTEVPISENGRWHRPSSAWSAVSTSGGFAFGTQAGSGAFDDSVALLSGFPPNQSASAVVHRDAAFAPAGGVTREVEIVLRGGIGSDGLPTWYECNYAFDGAYAQIVYIANGTFTYLVGNGGGGNPGPGGGVLDGKTITAQIVGNVITSSYDGTPFATFTDTGGAGGGARIASGNPGIAFWRGSPAALHDADSDYCFTSFSAVPL